LPPSRLVSEDEALINPRREPGEATVAARAILTFVWPDYLLLCRLAGAEAPPRPIWGCAIREGSFQGRPLTIAAPTLGAPYAAMVLEKLIVLGARLILALGWCGSLQPEVGLCTLVLPTAAVPGDGTSRHYAPEGAELLPDPVLLGRLRGRLHASGLQWHEGPVLTTDAFFRETVSLVRGAQARGILGVEMELAALLAVGQFRRVPVAALMVVADELGHLRWRPVQDLAAFGRAREQAAGLVLAAAALGDADA